MKIAPVQSNVMTLQTNPLDRQIQLLLRQKELLHDRIGKITEGQDSPQIKREKIESLQEQIDQIDSQIRQLQMEKIKKQPEDIKSQVENNNAKTDEHKENQREVSASTHFLLSVSDMSTLEKMGSIRTDLLNEARKASHSGKIPEAAEGIMQKVRTLEEKIAEKMSKIQDSLTRSKSQIENTEPQQDSCANDDEIIPENISDSKIDIEI